MTSVPPLTSLPNATVANQNTADVFYSTNTAHSSYTNAITTNQYYASDGATKMFDSGCGSGSIQCSGNNYTQKSHQFAPVSNFGATGLNEPPFIFLPDSQSSNLPPSQPILHHMNIKAPFQQSQPSYDMSSPQVDSKFINGQVACIPPIMPTSYSFLPPQASHSISHASSNFISNNANVSANAVSSANYANEYRSSFEAPPNRFTNSCQYQGSVGYPGGMGSMQQDFASMDISPSSAKMGVIDLLQERNLIKYGMEETSIIIPPSVCNSEVHCSPRIFRSTLCSVPQTQEMFLQSRLPFALSIQPFRDVKSLSVVQTSVIIRCHYCRTYINPYVFLPDSRHWKCNICQRVNDLPDNFNWDPATKSFTELSSKPELKHPTIEFIASSEYMLRPPQPAVYVFVLDVCHSAIESGYIYTFSEQLLSVLKSLPGDDRTMVGFLGVDSSLHFFQFLEDHSPRQLIVNDVYDIFLPVDHGLLINLRQNFEVVRSFVQNLPTLYESNNCKSNCLGSALKAAFEMIRNIGGRITVMQTILPSLGHGALVSREDPNQRASSDVTNLCAATDFYKLLALECTGSQIAVDLFLLNFCYADLSTISDLAMHSSGCIYHYPNYHILRNQLQVKRYCGQLNRYLTRKIGFEAVLRIRCTKGLSLHTFFGSCFIRSTDLLALPNVNPDSSLAVQIQMEDNLIGLNTVCFQAALLYTSSKGDRRIRIHTLCLPITKNINTVFRDFDAHCAASILCRMAVYRSITGRSLSDSRDAIMNAAIDALRAYKATAISSSIYGQLLCPVASFRFFPLYVLGMLKHNAFSSGTSVRLDDRVFSMFLFQTAPLEVTVLELFPALYRLDHLMESEDKPARLHLTFEHVSRDGIYLLDCGSYIYIYVALNVSQSALKKLFDVVRIEEVDEDTAFNVLDNSFSKRVHGFIQELSAVRATFAPVLITRDDGDMWSSFSRRFIEDRTTSSHSYIEFLHHLKNELEKA